MKNILEYLEHTVQYLPEKTVLRGQDESLSFRQLYDQSRSVGCYLLRMGIRNRAVAVLMNRRPAAVAAFLGAVYAGCWYTALDADMPAERMNRILEILPAPVMICDAQTEAAARKLQFSGVLLRYETLAFGIIEGELLQAVRQEQLDIDPVYAVFTSGSTGQPKGVLGCHRSVLDYIENLCSVLPLDSDSCFGNQSPLYFDAWLKEFLPALKLGGCVDMIPRQLFLFPARLMAYIQERKINTLCWVVSALTAVSATGVFAETKAQQLRLVAFASEVFPPRQLNLWRAAAPNARFFNLYGPTEATGICCWYEVKRDFGEDEQVPVGKPFPNTQILLLDGDQAPAAGQPGEICIRGTRLTLGYLSDGERTRAAFCRNPLNPWWQETIYRTGDMGRWNSRGELEFLGRRDHQIKHMGHRIELGEPEAAANGCAGVTGSCCLYSGGRLILCYCGTAEEKALLAMLRQRLPRYMLPGRLVRLRELPRTPNGKVDRKLLETLYGKEG